MFVGETDDRSIVEVIEAGQHGGKVKGKAEDAALILQLMLLKVNMNLSLVMNVIASLSNTIISGRASVPSPPASLSCFNFRRAYLFHRGLLSSVPFAFRPIRSLE